MCWRPLALAIPTDFHTDFTWELAWEGDLGDVAGEDMRRE